MQRHVSNWWLILLWIPVIALVLGLVAGCASTSAGPARAPAQPSHADLKRLVAQELDANSRFDSFASAENTDARGMAALFRPVLADVNTLGCSHGGLHA